MIFSVKLFFRQILPHTLDYPFIFHSILIKFYHHFFIHLFCFFQFSSNIRNNSLIPPCLFSFHRQIIITFLKLLHSLLDLDKIRLVPFSEPLRFSRPRPFLLTKHEIIGIEGLADFRVLLVVDGGRISRIVGEHLGGQRFCHEGCPQDWFQVHARDLLVLYLG